MSSQPKISVVIPMKTEAEKLDNALMYLAEACRSKRPKWGWKEELVYRRSNRAHENLRGNIGKSEIVLGI